MNTTHFQLHRFRHTRPWLPAGLLGLLLPSQPAVAPGSASAAFPAPPVEAVAEPAPAPVADISVPEPFSASDAALWSPADGGAWDPRYVTAHDTCLPRTPTCTSCADATCRCGGGAVRRWWNLRAKPCLQETHWGYCEYFDEPPFGAATRHALGVQAANGFRGQLVLYQYDFHPTCSSQAGQLNPYGLERLDQLACRLAGFPAPLVIESTPDQPGLDEQRKAAVLAELHNRGLAVSADCVVVQRRRDGMAGVRDGLQGDEAVLIYQNLLDQTSRRGAILGTSDGGTGGAMPMMGGEGSQ